MRVKLREFHPDDFEALWRMDQDCFAPGIAYSRLELTHCMRRSSAFTVIAEADRKIVGFLIAERWRQQGHIITIDISAAMRRHHIGSRLMLYSEKRLREDGCDWIVLETAVNNTAAITFYKRLNYVVVKTIRRYYEGNLDALLMAKRIANHPQEGLEHGHEQEPETD